MPTMRSKSARMMPRKRILSCVVWSSFIGTSFATDCYNPDQSNRNKDPDVPTGYIYYLPCSLVTKYSVCCRAPNNGGDTCLPNGLCQGYAADGSKPLWRESCTDPTWNSPFCLNLCTTGVNAQGGSSTYIRIPVLLICAGDWGLTVSSGNSCRWRPNYVSVSRRKLLLRCNQHNLLRQRRRQMD